jgi:hypothetical protein
MCIVSFSWGGELEAGLQTTDQVSELQTRDDIFLTLTR